MGLKKGEKKEPGGPQDEEEVCYGRGEKLRNGFVFAPQGMREGLKKTSWYKGGVGKQKGELGEGSQGKREKGSCRASGGIRKRVGGETDPGEARGKKMSIRRVRTRGILRGRGVVIASPV